MNLKIIILYCCCLIIVSCGNKSEKKVPVVQEKVISFYTDLDGNTVKLSDFKGKKILLNFWATWCTPCIKEMPSLVKAQEILIDEDYVFLFPTTDSLKKVNQFKENNPYPLQFLLFTSSLDKLNVYALPATFIYDTSGKIVKRIDGATEWDSDEILNQLRAVK